MDDLYEDLTETLLLARRYVHQRSDIGAREFFIRSDNTLVSDPRPDTNELGAFGNSISDCQKCQLAKGRTKVVFGSGNPEANLMFIGEGPGRDEDVTGLPFVGAAGQLLTKIIEATKLRREDVYITNVVKCRPPNNRNPDSDEIAACNPHLLRQIEIIKPELICALGKVSAQALLEVDVPVGKLRGKIHLFQGIRLIVTYHPAALLRNPALKKPTWEDMKLLRKALDGVAL